MINVHSNVQAPPHLVLPLADMAARNLSRRSTVLAGLSPIDLSEMAHVELLRRADTKYLLSERQAFQALARLDQDYRILQIDGRRLHRYQTLYYDTPDLAFYHQHHNGKRNRYKVRERTYSDAHMTFWEVKHKINADTTIKSRIPSCASSSSPITDAALFLQEHCPYPAQELRPSMLNTFYRITLVGTHSTERVTLDIGLCLLWNGMRISLNGIAIAEIKQDGATRNSEFIRQMRLLGVRPTSLSKYCIGVALLYPGVRRNNFKPQLIQINNILHQSEESYV